MVDELKPCPFCGDKANYHSADTVRCDNVYCDNDTLYSVRTWNYRPIEDGLQAHIDTLRNHEIELLSDMAHSTYACPHCQMKILQCGECDKKVRMQG